MIEVSDEYKGKKRFLVTSALPYVHGLPHLGNLVGSILPADAFARYCKLKGRDTIYICGSDAHGSSYEVAAAKEGITPEAFSQRSHEEAYAVLEKFNFDFDYYGTTNSKVNEEFTHDIFLKLYENGYLLEQKGIQAFCGDCKRFLSDRWVEGVCPSCGGLGRGSQCDDCGELLTPEDLKEPHCVNCKGKNVVFKETKHLYLDLPQFSDFIKDYVSPHEDWPPAARNNTLGWVKEGLKPRAITRDLKLGFRVPVPGFEGKVIYVWFDAPIGYIAFTKELGVEKFNDPDWWKEWWQSEDVYLAQYMAKDNIPFHALIFPSVLHGTGDPYHLSDYCAACQYLFSSGFAFSKSRGHGLTSLDALSIRSADYWKFVLLYLYPAFKDSEFSWEVFQSVVNNELADTVGNFIHRVFVLTFKYFDGKVPVLGDLDEKDRALVEAIKSSNVEVGAEFDRKVRFKEAIKRVLELARDGNAYLNAKEPWKKFEENPAEVGTTLNLCLNVVRSLAIELAPVIPESCDEVWKFLNEKGTIREAGWDSAGELKVESGRQLNKSRPLFDKVSDDEVKEWTEKFSSKERREDVKVESKGGVKPLVKYDDFAKLDLRVGTVLSAERLPKQDRLLKLRVDVGEESPRTLVAGIGKKYKPDGLKGMQIIVVVNLEPRKIAGVESNGMLLAVGDKKDMSLLTTDGERKPGEQVE